MSDKGTLDDAIALAVQAHRGQLDKGGAPYILHPLRVMLKLEGEERQITAVLHDTVEDCGIELALIRHRFGVNVAEAIDALSRREGESYMEFIERCGANPLARSVKWADIADNMDLSRIPNPTAEDRARREKYWKASDRLTAMAMVANRESALSQVDTPPQGEGK